MQEKRNKQRLIVLAILLLVTALVYWFDGKERAPVVDKDLFRTADLADINEVVLQSASDTLTLKYGSGGWKINGRYGADQAMIDVLFATLKQAAPRRPVASKLQDSLGRRVEQYGVKVSLLSGGKIVDTFFAGGNTAKTQSYFKRPGEEMTYLMGIPGYRVYTSGIFELPANGWRNRYVFGFNWRNFQGLEARFPGRENDGFDLGMDDRQSFGIRGITEADTAKLNNYLDAVSLLQVVEYTETSPILDSLGKTKPLWALAVKEVGGKLYVLETYSFPGKGRFAGRIDGKDWAFFQERDIVMLNRPKAFFSK